MDMPTCNKEKMVADENKKRYLFGNTACASLKHPEFREA